MKKSLIYLFIVFCIIFIIPSICTRKRQRVANINQNNIEEENKKGKEEDRIQYDYSKYSKINLYHTKTSQNEEIPIDQYLYGVVSAEMPASYEMEALKAQAIVARTYTIYQVIHSVGKHPGSDICDDSTCCQAWISKEDRLAKWEESVRSSNWDKIVEAVDSTQGKIITYEGKPIDAFFHSNSGGVTETAINVWGGTNFPYLQSVETAGEDGYSQYHSEVELSREELVGKLKEKHPEVQINFEEGNCIEIKEYTESKRVKTIRFGNIEIAGTEARSLLGLKSTNFSFEMNGDKIKFVVKGYGHGVGMSQTGADSMAKSGSNCEEIVKHFYCGVEICGVNDL